jgi:hypothetical protein
MLAVLTFFLALSLTPPNTHTHSNYLTCNAICGYKESFEPSNERGKENDVITWTWSSEHVERRLEGFFFKNETKKWCDEVTKFFLQTKSIFKIEIFCV